MVTSIKKTSQLTCPLFTKILPFPLHFSPNSPTLSHFFSPPLTQLQPFCETEAKTGISATYSTNQTEHITPSCK